MVFLNWNKRRNRNIERRSGVATRNAILMVNARVTEKRRQRINKLGAVALLVIALAGLAWGSITAAHVVGDALFAKNDNFTIRRLVLTSNGRLQPQHLREYTGLTEGMNLFGVDIHKIRQDLLAVPLVKTVRVSRQLPDTLIVNVTERMAIARLGQDDKTSYFAVDEDGFVLGPTARSPNLPSIIGVSDRGLTPGSAVAGIEHALALLKLCDTTKPGQLVRVASIDISRSDYLDVRLATGERVLVSRDEMAVKLDKLAEILRHAAERGQSVLSVDMTVSKNFPVQYRER